MVLPIGLYTSVQHAVVDYISCCGAQDQVFQHQDILSIKQLKTKSKIPPIRAVPLDASLSLKFLPPPIIRTRPFLTAIPDILCALQSVEYYHSLPALSRIYHLVAADVPPPLRKSRDLGDSAAHHDIPPEPILSSSYVVELMRADHGALVLLMPLCYPTINLSQNRVLSSSRSEFAIDIVAIAIHARGLYTCFVSLYFCFRYDDHVT